MDNDFRIMVVDDERIVREAIASHVLWGKYGISVVKTAANAIEALTYLEEYEVDLMLVDIMMPIMNGIELLKIVKSRYADIDFIILSGHAEFKFARDAIQYRAKDYLLKPLNEETLIDTVLRCRDERSKQQFIDTIRQKPVFSKLLSDKPEKYNYSQNVNKVLQIVDDEIANEKLSLKWICSHKLFLNENYLCKIFQKEVKQKFTSYLLERKMLLAMQLLTNDLDVLITDVAQATGFGYNSQYFSSVFKKYTGYTPTEYRKYIKDIKEHKK